MIPYLFALSFLIQTPNLDRASPFKNLTTKEAASLILLESSSNVGYRHSTAVIVDVEKRLAITAWHSVVKADSIQAIYVGKEIDSNPLESQQVFLKKQGVAVSVIFHESEHDLALIELKEMPADAKAISIAKPLPKPDCKLYLDGHPFEKNLLWQRLIGKAQKVQAANWDWSEEIHLRTSVLEIAATELGHGFSGGAVRNEANELVGMVIAGQNKNVYAVEGSVIAAFLKRAESGKKPIAP
jgi:hypothetical protein